VSITDLVRGLPNLRDKHLIVGQAGSELWGKAQAVGRGIMGSFGGDFMSENLYFIVRKSALKATGNAGGATDVGACSDWSAMPDRDQHEVVRVDLSGNVIDRFSPEESLRRARTEG
jgi:hypothetical protein